MTQRLSILLFLLSIMGELSAQKNIQSLELNFTGGLSTFGYSNDTLVIPHRRGSLGFGDDYTVNLEYQFHFAKQRIAIKTGLGFSQKEFNMQKYGLGDIIAGLLPFAGFKPDTFYLRTINVKGKYLSVPLSISYRLSKNLNHAVQFFAGVQMNTFFRVGNASDIEFDTDYFQGALALRDPLSRTYKQQVASLLVSISPHIDLRIRCYKGFGLSFNLFPISFYCNSFTRSMTTNSSNFNGTMGIFYQFSK